jgi:hypothetical protein
VPPQPAQEREPSRRRPWHQGPGDADCRWNLFSMYCRPVGQVNFANWLATTSAMSGKSPIHSSRRFVPGSRLVGHSEVIHAPMNDQPSKAASSLGATSEPGLITYLPRNRKKRSTIRIITTANSKTKLRVWLNWSTMNRYSSPAVRSFWSTSRL